MKCWPRQPSFCLKIFSMEKQWTFPRTIDTKQEQQTELMGIQFIKKKRSANAGNPKLSTEMRSLCSIPQRKPKLIFFHACQWTLNQFTFPRSFKFSANANTICSSYAKIGISSISTFHKQNKHPTRFKSNSRNRKLLWLCQHGEVFPEKYFLFRFVLSLVGWLQSFAVQIEIYATIATCSFLPLESKRKHTNYRLLAQIYEYYLSA